MTIFAALVYAVAANIRRNRGMTITTEVSLGEFLDKLTILEIKSERIRDGGKLVNIRKELDLLTRTWARSPFAGRDIAAPLRRLKAVNENLWDIEDRIRLKERDGAFDAEFIELARAVYIRNDERAAVKRELNQLLGSELIEEKSYADYRRNP
jgi:hypothetical protein